MNTFSISELRPAKNREFIIRSVLRDGIVCYPTDTLYGLGGNFFSLAVAEQIDRLKGREDSPYSVAVSGMDMLAPLVVEIPSLFFEVFEKFLPGKFTFLFKAALTVDPRLLRHRSLIGIRVPDVPPILELIRRTGVPWISTSVNRKGAPPLNDPDRIVREFPGLDILIDGGTLPVSSGSTIVDLTAKPPAVVRRGDDYDKIRPILE
jgi:L-threonylcarbamoyladenylate synthase